MNNLPNLFIILGLCWIITSSLEIGAKNNNFTCGRIKVNKYVERILSFRRGLRISKSIGFTWTVFVAKRSPRPEGPESEESDDYYDFVGFEDRILCKGFLIHPQVVITTARCVQDFLFTLQKNDSLLKSSNETDQQDPDLIQKSLLKNIEIRSGGWMPLIARALMFVNPPIIHEQIRYVSNMVIHPNYNCSSMEKNHALLFLSESFNMSQPDIGLLCLSDTNKITLRCSDVLNNHLSDQAQSQFCKNNQGKNLRYRERFIVCPKDLYKADKYYYSGILGSSISSSSEEGNHQSYFDSFIGNINWVRSFLRENGNNDTLYEI